MLQAHLGFEAFSSIQMVDVALKQMGYKPEARTLAHLRTSKRTCAHLTTSKIARP